MTIGTKSVLFGAHCFFLHPFFVAMAWWKLYGFPWDPRLWVAFFVHDIGYWGKPNMDGPEGERHPETGARIMGWLFDWGWTYHYGIPVSGCQVPSSYLQTGKPTPYRVRSSMWHDFCLYHSRYYSKRAGKPFSRLCVADKLVLSVEPAWLYLFRVKLSGELPEYLDNARRYGRGKVSSETPQLWYVSLAAHLAEWAYKHKDGAPDDTTVVRH